MVAGNALYFDSDAHAAIAGTLLGLLLREKDQPRGMVGIIAAHAITDSEGNYKPMLDVLTTDGKKFRLIIAEVG